MVNDFEFAEAARIPDPQRLVRAYHASTATLNLVRAFTTGGYADLRHVHEWNKGFVSTPANAAYEKLARDIDKAMKFMSACGADFDAMRQVEFFAAHEALLLDYERPLTRVDSRTGKLYDTSGHFIWVGERTRDLDGAHIDFITKGAQPRRGEAVGEVRPGLHRAVAGPGRSRIASRAASPSSPGWARGTSATHCPGSSRRRPRPARRRPGSVIPCTATLLNPRVGSRRATSTTSSRRCTASSMCITRSGTVPGGIHVELTGNDVTECLGGADKILDADLNKRYESVCDPRLNHRQGLELAFLVAEMLAAD
jgi:3-deoxy-7-phosphoheptulonate synthase